MSIEKVRNYLAKYGMADKILEFETSSATVELAAGAVGVAGARIAKTLSFEDGGGCILLVAAGDARVDNAAFKKEFGHKAKMLAPERAVELTGHAVGGVCPFAIENPNVRVVLDESMRRFNTIYPAAGSSNSAIELTMEQLYELSHAERWVNACKGWGDVPRIVDVHVHVFPDALAQRTLEKLSTTADGLVPQTDGTLANTRAKLFGGGESRFICQHIATKPHQTRTINDFAASVQSKDGNVISFGTVHPDCEDIYAQLEHVKELGLRGVKLHPEYQSFYPDEPRAFPIYDAACELGLPVLFHAGWDPLSPELVHATPERVLEVRKRFPKLTMIAAHMGGMKSFDGVMEYLAGTDMYFDTSMSSVYLTPEQLAAIIAKHGSERVLFGTDSPWSTPANELNALRAAGIEGDDLTAILSGNADRLFGL